MAKRNPEEIRAQREAFLAARATRKIQSTTTSVEKTAELGDAQSETNRTADDPDRAKSKPRTRPNIAKSPAKPPPAAKGDPNITRREFVNYAWLASIALFSVGTVGVGLWFAFPNFKAGQFGGQFEVGEATNVLPEVNAAPIPYTDGKFWLANLDRAGPDGELRQGILALYKVCTHLGCLYEWVPMTNRFECPCHGSKFALTGDYLAGPAPRSLDSFVIQALSPDGTITETDPAGNPLVINGDETLVIDTGQRILGEPRA
jgi:cytochrome b6-f complex iron-sulfur subunit